MKQTKKGFTLIELLVVIAIIAILAAILFPVFAKAREKARQIDCASNLKQIATATLMYNQDYDEMMYPHRWNCGAVCTQYTDGTVPAQYVPGTGGTLDTADNSGKRFFWMYILEPYIKSYDVFKCPSNPASFLGQSTFNAQTTGTGGYGYGGENSYGHNDSWISPAETAVAGGADVAPVSTVGIDRPTGTVLITDASYYGVGPDTGNALGGMNYNGASDATAAAADLAWQNAQGSQYINYYSNVGNALYSNNTSTNTVSLAGATSASIATQLGRHTNFVNVVFCDGHVKAINAVALVENMCYWVTNASLSTKGGVGNYTNHQCN